MALERRRRRFVGTVLLFCALLLAACSPPAAAAPSSASGAASQQPPPAPATAGPPSLETVPEAPPGLQPGQPDQAADAFSGEAALEHVRHLSAAIGPRAAGSSGSAAAAEYIAGTLAAYGYEVQRQAFTFPEFEQRAVALAVGNGSTSESAAPTAAAGGPLDAHALLYSASGRVSGPLVVTGFGRQEDFSTGAARGAIALIERGAAITFRDKAEAAARAGAVGAVIFNSEPHEFTGSLQVPSAIPVVAISGTAGRALRDQVQHGGLTARLEVDASVEQRTTDNVIATRHGSAPAAGPAGTSDGPRIVLVGAHYDSVGISPGANDNASGTAVLLEMARMLAGELPHVTLRFVAFGAEELGLLGSAHYVQSMPPAERSRVAAMLNFDMVGVGDALMAGGDEALVRAAQEAGRRRSLEVGRLGRALDSRSDQAPFMAAGIPAAFFHVWDDPDYHTPRDVVRNVSPQRLEQMGRIGTDVVRQLADS